MASDGEEDALQKAAAASVTQLLDSWNNPTRTKRNGTTKTRDGHNNGNPPLSCSTSLEWYRLGLVLAALEQQQVNDIGKKEAIHAVRQRYYKVLSLLPIETRSRCLSQLMEGLLQLLKQQQQGGDATFMAKDVLPAMSALTALVQLSPPLLDSTSDNSGITPPWVMLESTPTLTLVQALVTMVDDTTDSTSVFVTTTIPHLLASLLHCTIVLLSVDNDGAPQTNDDTTEGGLSLTISMIQQLIDEPGLWQTVQTRLDHIWNSQSVRPNKNWQQVLLQQASQHDATQRDYLASLLSSSALLSAEEELTWQHPQTPGNQKATKTTTSKDKNRPYDPMEQLIHQVSTILPDLGHGYIELALALHRNNVEETLAALFLIQDDPQTAQRQVPAQLLVADPSLPRATRRSTDTVLDDDKNSQDKQLIKASILAAEQQAADQAALVDRVLTTSNNNNNNNTTRDEYNDDYDDQWDASEGTSAVVYSQQDYAAIQTYNRVYRDMEAEDNFWKDMRNTNHLVSTQNKTKAKPKEKDDEQTSENKKYRGPDKGRGGRIPASNNPSAGRSGGRGKGRGGGGGGGRGKGRGGGQQGEQQNKKADSGATNNQDASPVASTQTSSADSSSSNQPHNARHKERKLANRRDQQKKAMYNRSG